MIARVVLGHGPYRSCVSLGAMTLLQLEWSALGPHRHHVLSDGRFSLETE
jgi:hypothetical protein